MIVRGLAAALFAASLGGCSHVSSVWSKLTNGHHDSAPAATVQSAVPPPASAEACNTLRTNAAPSDTADPASRQMAIDEMKRSGCPDVPAL